MFTMSGILANVAKKTTGRGFIRAYSPGRNWKMIGGINLRDGIADVPSTADPVYSSRREKLGVISLNRPKYRNCLDKTSFVQFFQNALNFESNEHMGSVMVLSSNSKVFSTGIDYKSCFFESNGNNMVDRILATKRREYDLINQINISDIPFITVMDGEVAADGAAIGIASRFPIITENTSLSFPEVRYGAFPDAGSSKLLNSLGGLGMYMALTGDRISGLDLMYYGIFQRYIERSSINSLFSDLSQNHSRSPKRIATILDSHVMPVPEPSESVIDNYNEISQLFNPCFHADTSVRDVISRLEGTSSEFAKTTLRKLEKGWSAGTLQMIWRSVVDASKLSMHGTLKRDYQLYYRLLHSSQASDFLSGIKARFIDKEHHHHHADLVLSDDTIRLVDSLFEPAPEAELSLTKTHHYDIPIFHGDAFDKANDESFTEVPTSRYDWDRIHNELYHIQEETRKVDEIARESRSFVHPVTGLTHPVPMEWEEDMRMARKERGYHRRMQLEEERDVVLQSMPSTKYEE